MSESERQRVVRVPGARRAKLTPAPGAAAEADAVLADDEAPAETATGASKAGASRGDLPRSPEGTGPNDERMRREVPPHY